MPFSQTYIIFHKVFDEKYMVHTSAVMTLSANLVQDRKQCKRSNIWTVKKGPGVKVPSLAPASNTSSVRALGSASLYLHMKLDLWAQESIFFFLPLLPQNKKCKQWFSTTRKTLLGATSNLQSDSYLGQSVTCNVVIYFVITASALNFWK